MNKVSTTAILLLAALSGCITPQTYPNKRPLTDQGLQVVGKTDVLLSENLNGIEKSWFMQDSSAAGAQYGLLGALVTGVMDAIMNSGPAKRAKNAAGEVTELMPVDALNTSLVHQLQATRAASNSSQIISLGEVSVSNKILKPDAIKDAVELSTSYTLSEDASTLRIIARVAYLTDKISYATPYKFKSTTPKSELTGPIYSNVFTYESQHLTIPALTPELHERLTASIENSYRDDSGALPAKDSKEAKAMKKELDAANDQKLTKDEIAIFLVREWLKDNGALLKREIESAHAFFAKYLVLDLNSTAIPAFDGQDEVLETLDDQRTVRRVGIGIPAGSYISSPGNVTTFTTYGNAISIAKVNEDRIGTLRNQVKAEKSNNQKSSNSKKR